MKSFVVQLFCFGNLEYRFEVVCERTFALTLMQFLNQAREVYRVVVNPKEVVPGIEFRVASVRLFLDGNREIFLEVGGAMDHVHEVMVALRLLPEFVDLVWIWKKF